MFKKLINFIKNKIEKHKKKKEFKKRIEELRKRDPFTYNH
jgi:ubiquinone biosynthesis protein COQ9